MDGIHDLGGRQGFGAVDVHEVDLPFHEAWEGRLLGLVRSMVRPKDWSVDWFRHCRELIEPVDYLTRPYYDQWLQAYAAMLINSGIATVEELAGGSAATPVKGLGNPMPPTDVAKAARTPQRFDRPATTTPAFAVGDAVRTREHGVPGHTRLAQYARGRAGVIESYHGHHPLPDAEAHGTARAEPLYTVAFAAAELWPEASPRDRVTLDLWESYLDRA